MKRAYLILKSISDICFWVGKILGTSSILAIFGSMFLQVVMRYVVHHPLIWPEGLCKVLFIWMSYLGAGLLIRTRGHILIDYIINKFPAVLQRILKYLFSIIMLFTIVIFSIYSLKLALNTKAYIYELGMLSEFWVWLSMPLAGLFMIVHMVFIIYEDIYNRNLQTH